MGLRAGETCNYIQSEQNLKICIFLLKEKKDEKSPSLSHIGGFNYFFSNMLVVFFFF